MEAHRQDIAGVSVRLEELLNVQSRLSGLSLRNFRNLSSLGSGARRVRVRGQGMEYEESRAYVVGDDIKIMDWRVMARTGEAHTKVFAEERERSFILAIDLSSSMFFGTHYSFKSWSAAQLAAHIGWLATFSGDRLGGLVVSMDSQYPVKPGKTRTGLMSLFHRLAESCNVELPVTQANSRLNLILGELQHSVKPGSIIVVISDFLGIDENTPGLLQPLAKHNDMIAFWVHDRTETELWRTGPYPIEIGEDKFILDTANTVAAEWLSQQQQAHRSQVENLTSRFNIGLRPISCNRDITSQLLPYLKY
jgi:uncharacterized protein (DUF58 family)